MSAADHTPPIAHDEASLRQGPPMEAAALSSHDILQSLVLRRLAHALREVLAQTPHDVVLRAAVAESDEALLRTTIEIVLADGPDRDRPHLHASLAMLDQAVAAGRVRAKAMMEASGVTIDDLYRMGALPANRARELGVHVEQPPTEPASLEELDSRIATLLDMATAVLGNRTAALDWITTPHRALGTAVPLSLLGTVGGVEHVAMILGRLRPPVTVDMPSADSDRARSEAAVLLDGEKVERGMAAAWEDTVRRHRLLRAPLYVWIDGAVRALDAHDVPLPDDPS